MKLVSTSSLLFAALLLQTAICSWDPAHTRTKPPFGSILSCSDAQCYNCSAGSTGTTNIWNYNSDSAHYPKCQNHVNNDFSGAENKEGGGFNIYWSVNALDTLCKVLILSPVTQFEASSRNCGNVVAIMDQPGCYETPALAGDQFMIQYCCGSHECLKATGELKVGRDVEDDTPDKVFPDFNTLESQREPILELLPNDSRGQSATVSVLEEEEQDEILLAPPPRKMHSRRFHSTDICEERQEEKRGEPSGHFHQCDPAEDDGDIFTKAGNQTRLTRNQFCNTHNGCSQQVSKTIQVSHAITNTRTTSFTETEKFGFEIGAGFDFIENLSMKGSVGMDLSHSIQHSCGTTDTTAVSTAVTATFDQPGGTRGFIWFTPNLVCQKKRVRCYGKDPCKPTDFELEKCDPQVDSEGQVIGDLGFTTI